MSAYAAILKMPGFTAVRTPHHILYSTWGPRVVNSKRHSNCHAYSCSS